MAKKREPTWIEFERWAMTVSESLDNAFQELICQLGPFFEEYNEIFDAEGNYAHDYNEAVTEPQEDVFV